MLSGFEIDQKQINIHRTRINCIPSHTIHISMDKNNLYYSWLPTTCRVVKQLKDNKRQSPYKIGAPGRMCQATYFPLKVRGNLLVHFKVFHNFALHWSSHRNVRPPFDPGPATLCLRIYRKKTQLFRLPISRFGVISLDIRNLKNGSCSISVCEAW